MANEQQSTQEATQQVSKILDTNYMKADLQAIVSTNCTHLSLQDQNSLLELLTEFEELFDGTLEGAKPYHGKAYRVPKSRKETTIKELNKLCELGVVEFQPESEWASPSFITGKKDGTGTSDSHDQNVEDLRKFLGVVQFYRDLWARRSEVLAPLTSLVGECGHTKVTRANKTKKRPWYWDTVHQKAFDDVKTTIAKDVVLAYPDYSREFEIYTDASSKQLGSVITQGNRPLAFFSRKLSTAQQKYSMTKLELLAIVETLKEFKGMLWGQRLKVYTDHKNLIQDALGLTSDRVYRWRLLLEEFGPEIVYIKGIHNTVADAISCLDIGPIPSEHENWMPFTKCWCYYTMLEESAIDTSANQEEMNLVFANRSEEDVIYPLTVREIAEAQKLDASLKTMKDQYLTQLVESTELLCKDGKMIIPKDLQHRAVSWYHHYLQHPGHTRLEETLRAAMYWKALCDSYGITSKPTSVKNPQANAILERVHQVISSMLRTAEIDMAPSVEPSDIDTFVTNVAWAIRSTYHTVLKASPGAAIFGRDMLFDIPFLADWNKIGEYRQHQTDQNTERENRSRRDWDYKIGDQVLLRKDGILSKGNSRYESDPWTITTVHTNGTIRIQRGTKSERLNIRRASKTPQQHVIHRVEFQVSTVYSITRSNSAITFTASSSGKHRSCRQNECSKPLTIRDAIKSIPNIYHGVDSSSGFNYSLPARKVYQHQRNVIQQLESLITLDLPRVVPTDSHPSFLSSDQPADAVI
ncbi:hypothetical protein HJC23_007929 [Cyclotella cryptica]|uniref:Reverse transcriptase/retrotransposon-derived protein RNase H-like domain-containing protein n=1 Tax=Cyclotella cryptica TaxID=29204 RepID=A0ABD3NZC9_9STRA